jgi:hypothetical protein
LEAISRKKEVDEMKALQKEHSYSIFTYDQGTRTIVFTEGSGYDQIQSGILDYAVSETYFDMAGMTHDEKTLFFEAIAVQEGSNFEITGPTGAKLWVYDLITSIPFDVSNWDYRFGLGWSGTSAGELNFEHVLYGRYRLFANDVDFAGTTPVQVTSDTFGSGQPTNSDRLYSYRIIIPFGTVAAAVVPPARHLVLADIKDEPEYVQLMRMMRSYELQQAPDRD